MTKKEKLRIYNDCVHEIGLLKDGNSVNFYAYKKWWRGKPLKENINKQCTVSKEHDYYCVDAYIITNFLEVVAMACRHCLTVE